MSVVKIYVVVGSTGEYSDHTEWYVKAFASKEKGEQFIEEVSAEYRVLAGQYKNYWDIPRGANRLDPDMQSDYTGTNYYLAEVPFDSEVHP